MKPAISPKLITVGDNCLDVYLNKNVMSVGGNALNVAVQWIEHGWEARYFGAIGNDKEGEIIRRAVALTGLSPDDLEYLAGNTAVTLLQEKTGDRRFLLEDLGTGKNYIPSSSRYMALKEADWVHLGTNSSQELIQRLVSDHVPFSVDISTSHFALNLDHVPLVFASGPENPDANMSDVLDPLLQSGAQAVVMTCGRKGAFFCDQTSLLHVDAKKIDVIDTCGAGDSFIARFIIARHFEKKSARTSLLEATESAAETCLHQGGFPQDLHHIPPWLPEKYADVIASAKDY